MSTFLSSFGDFLLRYPIPFLIIAALVNIIAFVFYGVDKHKAKKGLWRISENTLIFFSLIGGGLGSLLGMFAFHHKTRHIKFRILVPIFFLLYTAILAIALVFATISIG